MHKTNGIPSLFERGNWEIGLELSRRRKLHKNRSRTLKQSKMKIKQQRAEYPYMLNSQQLKLGTVLHKAGC